MTDYPALFSSGGQRFKLIACEIFYREICACVARSRHVIDVEFLSQGLHDLPSGTMAARVQKAIDTASPDRYAGVLLGFALCNNGVVGLSHPSLPIVMPRAHDCIALFLGSRATYDSVFGENPGTFYKTAGWIERDHTNLEDESVPSDSPFSALQTFESYVAKYGEENALYLMETMLGLKNYSRMVYIDLPGLAPLPHADETRRDAERLGLQFEQKQGDLRWLQRLTDGPWDAEDFLVVQPGERIAPAYDGSILRVEPALTPDSSAENPA
jgi:hypothetical protein